MKDVLQAKSKEFLYNDEKVKYSFTDHEDRVTINCDHRFFTDRFKTGSVTLSLSDFFNSSHKGSPDYNFFQKFQIALQEVFLNEGVRNDRTVA
jgi:hypothetical protein